MTFTLACWLGEGSERWLLGDLIVTLEHHVVLLLLLLPLLLPRPPPCEGECDEQES